MIERRPRAGRQQVLENIWGFGSMSSARTEATARSRANRRRRLMTEEIEEYFRAPCLRLHARPNTHHKRQLITKRDKLRRVRFFIRARWIELQKRVRLIAETRARTLDKLLGRGGLKEERSFVLIRPDE